MKVSRKERKLWADNIKAYVDLCLMMLEERGFTTLQAAAEECRLSPTTIWRLRHGYASVHTHAGTLQVLADAAGFSLELERNTIRMSLASKAS